MGSMQFSKALLDIRT